jgi:cold shock CspA family protein
VVYERVGWWRCGNGCGYISEGRGESMVFVEGRGGREGQVKGLLGGRADCFAEPFRS